MPVRHSPGGLGGWLGARGGAPCRCDAGGEVDVAGELLEKAIAGRVIAVDGEGGAAASDTRK
jgi:hypothetical protein